MKELRPISHNGIYSPGITSERRRQIQEFNKELILKTAGNLVRDISLDKAARSPLDRLIIVNSKLLKGGFELEIEIGGQSTKIHIYHHLSKCLGFMDITYPPCSEPNVLEIKRELYVMPEYQGHGLGTGLFLTEDCLTRKAMKLLRFDEWLDYIYAHLADDTANRDQYFPREGWARAVGLNAGYCDDFPILVKHLGREDAVRFRNRSAIKVYQDKLNGILI